MLLFITRKYPPSIGGMQKFSYDFAVHMRKLTRVEVVAWGRSNLALPIFLIYALFYASYLIKRRKIKLVHLGDGLLSPLGVVLKLLHQIPITVTVHGLDVTYPDRIYQWVIPRSLKKLDKIICVSNETKRECINRKILKDRIVVIPNGINREELCISRSKQELLGILSKKLNMDITYKEILLSVGRLVERKGFHWFLEEVIPQLIENKEGKILYFIVGEGPFRWKIEEIIKSKNLEDNVYLLGKVDDETLKFLYNASDLFVMPNIPVKGNLEGFGIVILEATSCELPVVASNLEGIKDAIQNGENGLLVEPYDAEGYITTILGLLKDKGKREVFGKMASKFTNQYYNWDVISERYYQEFDKVRSADSSTISS
jgi:glycosyltransferase involved in cell wall biosynthesis